MNHKKIISRIAAVAMAAGVALTSLPVYAAPTVMSDGGVFDDAFYSATYPDVVKAFGNDANLHYLHYKTYGIKEGRLPYAPGTDVSQLLAAAQTATTGTVLTAAEKAAAVNILNKYLTGERFWEGAGAAYKVFPTDIEDIKASNPMFAIADLNGDGVKELWLSASGSEWNMNLLPTGNSNYWNDLVGIYGYDAKTNTYLQFNLPEDSVVDANGNDVNVRLTKKKRAAYTDIIKLVNAQPLTVANVTALAQ